MKPLQFLTKFGRNEKISGKQKSLAAGKPKNRTMVFVHLIYRHGDRTPVKLIPTDTANNLSTWFQNALGELTPMGMKEHFILGQQLAQRYSNWVDPASLATQMRIRSTDYNRTLMSAYANLAGMFHRSTDLMKPNVNGWPGQWQAMPVHTMPLNQDNVLWWPLCKSADWYIKPDIVYKSSAWLNLVKQNQNFLNEISNKSGIGNLTLDKIWMVRDPLHFESIYHDKHKLPPWVTPSVFNKIQGLWAQSSMFLFHQPELARLKGGSLLGEILGRMINKAKCTVYPHQCHTTMKTLKLYVYSAHDLTLMALLETLARTNVGSQTGAAALTGGKLPSTASCIAFELYQETDGSFSVEVYFKNDYNSSKWVSVPVSGGCASGHCSLTAFRQRSLPFIPLNWKYECDYNVPKWPRTTATTTTTGKNSGQPQKSCGFGGNGIVLIFAFLGVVSLSV